MSERQVDIFSRTKGQASPLWLEAVDTFEKAFLRLIKLCADNPGDYFAAYQAEIVAEVRTYGSDP